jgi:hypothetical protein
MTRDDIIFDCLTIHKWRVNTIISSEEVVCIITSSSGLQLGYAKGSVEVVVLKKAYDRAIHNYHTLNQNRLNENLIQTKLFEGESDGS